MIFPVFGSLDMSRSNSMTSAGQCRLAPLIPCIQDASKLYDYCVKILFRLHSSLPPDILTGHRERFLKQFKNLKVFYQNTNALQYFKDLITVPPLPEVSEVKFIRLILFAWNSECLVNINVIELNIFLFSFFSWDLSI